MSQLDLLTRWQFIAWAAAPAMIIVLWKKWQTPALIERLLLGKREYKKKLLLSELSELEEMENSQNKVEDKEVPISDPLKMPETHGNLEKSLVKPERIQVLDRICIKRNGVLTSINEKTCTFDFEHEFDKQLTQHIFADSLNIGSVIQYLAYKATAYDKPRIFKLLEFEEESWDDNCTYDELMERIKKYAAQNVEMINVSEYDLNAKVINVSADKELTIIANDTQFHINNILLRKIMLMPDVGDFIKMRLIYYKSSSTLQNQIINGDLLEVLEIDTIDEQEYELTPKKNTLAQNKPWVEIKCQPTLTYTYKNSTTEYEIIIKNNRKDILKLMGIDILIKNTGENATHICLNKANLFANGEIVINENEQQTIYLNANKSGAVTKEKILLKFNFEKFKLNRIIQEVYEKEDAAEILYKQVPIQNEQLYAYKMMENANQNNYLPAPSLMPPTRFRGHNIDIYEIPQILSKAYFASGNTLRFNAWLKTTYQSVFNTELNMTNYRQRFQLLLHLEELIIFENFRKFDLKAARFYRDGDYLCLEIENLQERRPSLVVGDMVRVKNVLKYGKDLMDVDGFINRVLQNKIFIKFHEQFMKNYDNESYCVLFNYSRYCLRKMHHAIKIMSSRGNKNILFPDIIELRDEPQIEEIRLVGTTENDLRLKVNKNYYTWYNNALNLFQKRAICNILNGVSSLPYCIFGPPGTGKTVTVVETILQLLQHVPKSRILIATPSNAAADLIATRLLKFMSHIQLLRIVAHSVVEKESIPAELLKYCATVDIGIDEVTPSEMSVNSDGVILRVPKKFICNYRVIIGTCSTLGTLMQIRFDKDHFTHAIIDEAAQCTEADTMCVLSLLGPRGQIILSGDPNQLPPTILSPVANSFGLQISYMERLLECSPYSLDIQLYPNTNGYDSRLVTMLIYNYRALPSILRIYNWMFYGGNLKPMVMCDAEPEFSFLQRGLQVIRDGSVGAENRILDTNHASYFCSINGINQQDFDSPSWYNLLEAQQVFKLVTALYEQKVKADDIGIITPYIKQVRLLRNLFNGIKNGAPKIGSIEEFQGQERQIILVSTVRTSNELLSEDKKHRLGFLADAKRINVALSRARALLIVIGNAELLSHDSHWLTYMTYCHENSAYFGDEISINIFENIMEGKPLNDMDKIMNQLCRKDPTQNRIE